MSPRAWATASAVALAFVTGCDPDGSRPCDGEDTHEEWAEICGGDFGFADGFTVEEKDAMRGAAARWNAFVGASLVQVRAGRATCRIVPGTLPEGRTAWYAFDTGTITIDRAKIDRDFDVTHLRNRVDGADLEATIMHEIGHSLGLQHAHDGGIMCAASRDDFNASDRAQCTGLGWCP